MRSLTAASAVEDCTDFVTNGTAPAETLVHAGCRSVLGMFANVSVSVYRRQARSPPIAGGSPWPEPRTQHEDGFVIIGSLMTWHALDF